MPNLPEAPWTLRLGRESDIAALQAVEREADQRFRAAGHPELADGSVIPDAVAARAMAAGQLWVAECAGQVVGWAYTGRFGDELCLGQISVATAYGQRGIGGALLDAAIAQARGAGASSLVLTTQRNVAWNAPWYLRRGFEIVPPVAWTPAQQRLSAAQEADGLDWRTRVHMRLVLKP